MFRTTWTSGAAGVAGWFRYLKGCGFHRSGRDCPGQPACSTRPSSTRSACWRGVGKNYTLPQAQDQRGAGLVGLMTFRYNSLSRAATLLSVATPVYEQVGPLRFHSRRSHRLRTPREQYCGFGPSLGSGPASRGGYRRKTAPAPRLGRRNTPICFNYSWRRNRW